jgi:histidyl-tRNA synthetase
LREFRQFDLEILGTEKSIADALIIRTLYTILEEFGFKDLIVDINSMGDRDTRNSYVKDLTNYYKKNVANMCADCMERVKTNPLRLLDCKKDECQKYKENAPQSIAYLSADARKHFKEVLQYLEEMNISYRINHTLVRGFNYYNRTVFEVVKMDVDDKGNEKEISICGGGRYDPLARDMGSKKDVPAVGTGMSFERIMLFPECRDLSPRILKTPKVYFIQLGFDAKLKSLTVIEILRKAKVPVHQNLSKDSLGVQLSMAEKMNIPYCIIFGQKEAVDGTVIVRKMAERHQDVVKIDNLAEYLKNIK